VIVSWDWPDNRGSPITAYTITVRENDSATFTTELTDCDGTDSDIVLNRLCSIPISTLRLSPFSLAWGSTIYARVIAINVYGQSTVSSTGSGTIILTNPDSPTDLEEDRTITTGTQIGLVWVKGIDNGGTPVLDYKVWSDQAENDYIPLAEGVTDLFFTATGLSVGFTYNFKVQSRNLFGFSDDSSIVTILAAQMPD
jgi:hypothetical protein